MVDMTTHFTITGKEKQLKLNSSGSFEDGCLCGNGSYHAKRTKHVKSVDCVKCIEILASNPHYLER